jgi:hypothetical protein
MSLAEIDIDNPFCRANAAIICEKAPCKLLAWGFLGITVIFNIGRVSSHIPDVYRSIS